MPLQQHILLLVLVISTTSAVATRASVGSSISNRSELPAQCLPHCHAGIDYAQDPLDCTSYANCDGAAVYNTSKCPDSAHPYFDNSVNPPPTAYSPCTHSYASCLSISEDIIQDCGLERCQSSCLYATQKIYEDTSCIKYRICEGVPGSFSTVTLDCAAGLYFDGWACQPDNTACCGHDCRAVEDFICPSSNSFVPKCPTLCIPEYFHCTSAGKHPTEGTCDNGLVFHPEMSFCVREEDCDISNP